MEDGFFLNKLRVMIEVSKVFLLLRCDSDEAEDRFKTRLASTKMGELVPQHVCFGCCVIEAPQLICVSCILQRVLVHCTDVGKIAIVRALKVGIHFESKPCCIFIA